MSGMAGIFSVDGAPLDRDQITSTLHNFISAMRFRGPHAQTHWHDESTAQIGMAHTLLRTTFEAAFEQQPMTLDGSVWIVADARVDARGTLRAALQAATGHVLEGLITDVEYLLRAYLCWGIDCVDHLLGDFVFAIWDAAQQRLFCACDHYSVKVLYYAQVGQVFYFSNTLEALRLHTPISPTALNETAIGDMLLFVFNYDSSATYFRDIKRLPGAHRLVWEAGRCTVEPYWALPIQPQVRYKRDDDYLEHYREVLRVAIADRMRTERVGVMMSGGKDSTTIAALAVDVMRTGHPQSAQHLKAYTKTYQPQPDVVEREAYFAQMVADHLRIPIQFFNLAAVPPFSRLDDPAEFRPHPIPLYDLSAEWEVYRTAIELDQTHVLFDGEGDFIYQHDTVIEQLGHGAPLGYLMRDAWHSMRMYQQRPWLGLRAAIQQRLNPALPGLEYYAWVPAHFRHRWDDFHRLLEDQRPSHPLHSHAHRLGNPKVWSTWMEMSDANVLGFPVELRMPMFDVRVIQFMLALPAMEWLRGKKILQRALRGYLPEAVLTRRKEVFDPDPLADWLGKPESAWLDTYQYAPITSEFVMLDALPKARHHGYTVSMRKKHAMLYPLALDFWLRNLLGTPPTRYTPL
jgi:asparagine synthase (glutamine-hydrolysing)